MGIILKPTRKKHQVNCKDKPKRIRADFSTKTFKPKRALNDVFQALKENNST
jgi:hypothetical protein